MRAMTAIVIIVLLVIVGFLVIKNKQLEDAVMSWFSNTQEVSESSTEKTEGAVDSSTEEADDVSSRSMVTVIPDHIRIVDQAPEQKPQEARQEEPIREEYIPPTPPEPSGPADSSEQGGNTSSAPPQPIESGSDSNPGQEDERLPDPPMDPCANKLSGELVSRYFDDNIRVQRFDMKGMFKDLIPDYLALDERFRIEMSYCEPDGNGGEREVLPCLMVTEAQIHPVTKENLTLTGFMLELIQSRIEWFREQIGGGFCSDRFRFSIYNARTGKIYSKEHFSFTF